MDYIKQATRKLMTSKNNPPNNKFEQIVQRNYQRKKEFSATYSDFYKKDFNISLDRMKKKSVSYVTNKKDTIYLEKTSCIYKERKDHDKFHKHILNVPIKPADDLSYLQIKPSIIYKTKKKDNKNSKITISSQTDNEHKKYSIKIDINSIIPLDYSKDAYECYANYNSTYN